MKNKNYILYLHRITTTKRGKKMKHKISAIISSCIIAFMMASCTVSTHTTTHRTPPPPPPAHYGHPHPHHGPGPKRYPIDQFRKGPAPQHYHKGPQAPPPPAKNNIRDVERNGVRNNGTEPSQRRNDQQSVRSGSSQQRGTQSRTSPSTRSQGSGGSSTPSTGRSGGRR